MIIEVEKITTKIVLLELFSSKVVTIMETNSNNPVNNKIALCEPAAIHCDDHVIHEPLARVLTHEAGKSSQILSRLVDDRSCTLG